MARPISCTPWPMLTTAACPAASRNRRPSSSMIQQPSPRTAMGKVFLKLREKSPPLVAMNCPGRNCSRVGSGRDRSGGPEPLLHLFMADQAGLLHHRAATKEDGEVGYATNMEARSKLRIFFRIDFQHDSLARHVSSGSCDFRSSSATRRTPRRPEVHEFRNGCILNNFIE